MAKKSRRSYGRRKAKRHSKGGFKFPIVSLAILGGQVGLATASSADPLRVLGEFGSYYTGFDSSGHFDGRRLAIGYGPWAAKWLIGKVGILRPANAMLSRMHLPVSIA